MATAPIKLRGSGLSSSFVQSFPGEIRSHRFISTLLMQIHSVLPVALANESNWPVWLSQMMTYNRCSQWIICIFCISGKNLIKKLKYRDVANYMAYIWDKSITNIIIHNTLKTIVLNSVARPSWTLFVSPPILSNLATTVRAKGWINKRVKVEHNSLRSAFSRTLTQRNTRAHTHSPST